jgi:hypothetical protein
MDDGVLNYAFRRFIGWVYIGGKLQSLTATHYCGMWVVWVFEVTDNVDGRPPFTGKDANGFGFPQTLVRHDLNNRKGGGK